MHPLRLPFRVISWSGGREGRDNQEVIDKAVVESAGRRRRGGHITAARIESAGRACEQALDELLHQVERSAEQAVVLPEPLVEIFQDPINLLDERGQERPVLGRHPAGDVAQGGAGGKPEIHGVLLLLLLAELANGRDLPELGVDLPDVRQYPFGRAGNDERLLLLKQSQQLAAFREFITQRADQTFQKMGHLSHRYPRLGTAARGVKRASSRRRFL